MRRIMLVVGIGAGLFALAALHIVDSMAVELGHKKNFNLLKLVPPPAPALSRVLDVAQTEVNNAPTEYTDYSSNSDHRLVLKKNFNVLPPALGYPNEKVISVDLADPDPYDGKPPDPTELADEVYYRPPVMFPLPNGGNDHADSPDRTAGNDRRRSPRP
jgi:hypothetical protein